ncbi:MAG TPA: hypothetical protein VGM01_10145 [Ktedonobacteraceae bacterium]
MVIERRIHCVLFDLGSTLWVRHEAWETRVKEDCILGIARYLDKWHRIIT